MYRKHFVVAPKRFSSTRRWGFKKIPSQNIFSSWRKMILKKVFDFLFGEKMIFRKTCFFEKSWFFFRKHDFSKNHFFSLIFFSKSFFSTMKKYFLMGFFLKPHLLVEENRFGSTAKCLRHIRVIRRLKYDRIDDLLFFMCQF